jgi:hypothetical protein
MGCGFLEEEIGRVVESPMEVSRKYVKRHFHGEVNRF